MKNPEYPVYIVSKGRWENCLTSRILHGMDVPHKIVVEESEYDLYNDAKNDSATIIILPQFYLDEYDTCDDLGDTKSKGPGAARNFCMDDSSLDGFKKHWVMDDNMEAFYYLNRNNHLQNLYIHFL